MHEMQVAEYFEHERRQLAKVAFVPGRSEILKSRQSGSLQEGGS